MSLLGVLAVGRQLVHQLLAPGHGEAGGDADMVEDTLVVVHPEQQRADDAAALVPAEPCDDAVRGALVLDLQHDALVLAVRLVDALGDHPVETGALEAGEPVGCDVAVLGERSQVDGGLGVGEHGFELRSAGAERSVTEIVVAEGEQIERHERSRRLLGQHPHPGLGGVDQERLEVEAFGRDDDDLAVDHAPRGQLSANRVQELGEVAGQGSLVATAQLHLVAVAEDDAPEAVPFGLEDEPVALGKSRCRLRQHGLDGGHDREVHPSPSDGPGPALRRDCSRTQQA